MNASLEACTLEYLVRKRRENAVEIRKEEQARLQKECLKRREAEDEECVEVAPPLHFVFGPCFSLRSFLSPDSLYVLIPMAVCTCHDFVLRDRHT